jgi:branched-chain amino acid transport system permease protein
MRVSVSSNTSDATADPAATPSPVDPVGSPTVSTGWSTPKVLTGFAVATVVAAAPAFLGIGSYWLYLASLTLVYFLGAAGLNLILGYAGQISLAQGAFMGVGGYTVAILAGEHGWPMPLALVAGAVLGFALGLLVGGPALRVSTHYLAMVTLGVEVIFLLVAANQTVLTGGALGISGVPRPSVGPIQFTSDPAYHVFVAVVVMLVLFGLYVILSSTWGRAFKSIRENEMRAWMLGVNVRAYKLLAFAIGCATAAVAGALLASLVGFVDPDTYPLNLSFMLLLMVVVGGRGRFEGPLLGAILVTIAPEVLRGTQNLYLVIFAVVTLLVLMFMPKGLISLWDRAYLKVRGRPAPQLTK